MSIERIRGPEGYARLFRTLVNDLQAAPRFLFEWLYDLHKANVASYNLQSGTDDPPMPKDDFTGALVDQDVKPYGTMTQTYRAMEYLRRNIATEVVTDKNRHAVENLGANLQLYRAEFQSRYALDIQSPYTSYRSCADALDPARIRDFIEPSSELAMEPARSSSVYRSVYICVPLRGRDMEANIAAARDHARKLFEQGVLPICPHIYFPQFADPLDKEQDAAAMGMALDMLRRCDEVHVLGGKLTPGMQMEVNEAKRLGIPIVRVQPELNRGQNHRREEPERS